MAIGVGESHLITAAGSRTGVVGYLKRLGTKHLMDIFGCLRESLKSAGLIRQVFTFVDSSHLVSKLSTWEDRDRAIAEGLETFNNRTAKKVAADPQTRFGAKGKGKFWYGHERACERRYAVGPDQQDRGHPR